MKTQKRGALTRRNATPVSIPLPRNWVPHIQSAVTHLDTDRSKFVRAAIKEKLRSMNIVVPEM